jgi:hypothetical protein
MSKKSDKQKAQAIEQVAEMAMKLSQPHLADYGATTSRHDFTQRQLMACLVLRAYLNTTYRGLIEVLAVSSQLRQRLGLGEKLPHYTTLQKFSARSQVLAIAQKLVETIGKAAAAQGPEAEVAAMDSTGLELTTASAYFRSRRGKGTVKKWVKVSVMIFCGSLLPLALEVSMGPRNDCTQVPGLLAQAQAVAQPQRLYADAGYDAEWIHQYCREQWQVESIIKPITRRADGQRSGKYRAQMSDEHLRQRGYGQRWAVESFFSALKRTSGSALRARRPDQMIAEACFKVLAYTLRR